MTTEGDDEGCLIITFDQIKACIQAVVTINSVVDDVSNSLKNVLCVTKKIFFAALKKALVAVSVIDAGLLVYRVAVCLNLW
jgi:hypothetical protein